MTGFIADKIGLSPEERSNPYTTTIYTMNECWAAGWSRDDTAYEVVDLLRDHFIPEGHAVFDTRTHVAVELSAIKDAINCLAESDDDEFAAEMVFGWLRDVEREVTND